MSNIWVHCMSAVFALAKMNARAMIKEGSQRRRLGRAVYAECDATSFRGIVSRRSIRRQDKTVSFVKWSFCYARIEVQIAIVLVEVEFDKSDL